jgi:hypothetical protein
MKTLNLIFRNSLVSFLICFAISSKAVEPLPNTIQKIELLIKGKEHVRMPFEWNTNKKDSFLSSLDIGAGSEHDVNEKDSFVLNIVPNISDTKLLVRQRSVTYLNIGDEGPHISIDGSNKATRWMSLNSKNANQFDVLNQAPTKLNLTRSRIISLVNKSDMNWYKLAKTCKSENDGACYVATDTEFEISVIKGKSVVSKGIVRIIYPNGC